MQAFLRLAQVLTVATTVLWTSVAQAAPPTPRGNGRPALSYVLDYAPFIYWDADWRLYGPGQLQLLHVGNDPNNDTVLVRAVLKQGGRTYTGSGVVVGNKLSLTMGNYVFQSDLPGWGSYHVAGNPNRLYWFYLESVLRR
jgi:hypothetical protein